jgi:hypothetical protein
LQLQQRASRIQPVPVQLDPILERVALQFKGSAQRKGIDFRTLRTRAVIMSQPVLLDGILRNLARNAVDHTHRPAAVSSSAADVTQRLFASRFTTQARAFRRMSYKEFSSPFFASTRPAPRVLVLGCSSSSERPIVSDIAWSFVRYWAAARVSASSRKMPDLIKVRLASRHRCVSRGKSRNRHEMGTSGHERSGCSLIGAGATLTAVNAFDPELRRMR